PGRSGDPQEARPDRRTPGTDRARIRETLRFPSFVELHPIRARPRIPRPRSFVAMAAAAPDSAPRRGHPRWAVGLILLRAVPAFAAIFPIWVNRQPLNTDNWVDTSTHLIQNEEVRDRLADYLANELVANADIADELREVLPPRLAPLASAAAGGLQQLA